MKKIIIITVVLSSIMSCSDSFLEVDPKDKLSSSTFWKTENDAELALSGCYRGWESFANIVFLDAASDNGYEQFDYGYRAMGNGEILATNGWGSWIDTNCSIRSWFPYYRIKKYNSFLENIDNIEMDESLKERYKSEVRFLRAYDYFCKVMFYGDIPLVKEVIDDPEESSLSRNPKEDVESFILSELSEISEKLPVQNTIESEGHITKGAALALKARFELYLGKYAEAMSTAKSVIDMQCYELFPDYKTMFYPESESSNKEAILNIQYIKNDYYNRLPQLTLPASDGGWSASGASWEMIKAYQMANGKYIDDVNSGYDENKPFDNRDPRLDITILCPGKYYNGRYYNPLDKQINGTNNLDFHENAAASRGGLLVKKHVYPMSSEDMNNYDSNIMVIRLAEMYIIYAECAVVTGTEQAKALDLINAIRQRVGMPPAEALTEKLVRNERRVELAFEGLRYFDIKRWDLGAELLNGILYGSRDGSVNNETGEVTWKDSYIKLENRNFYIDRKYLLPIPQTELDRNENMTQNTGY